MKQQPVVRSMRSLRRMIFRRWLKVNGARRPVYQSASDRLRWTRLNMATLIEDLKARRS